MPTFGPHFPNGGASTAPGDAAWTDTENIFDDDASDAICNVPGSSGVSEYLDATNFAFSLPGGSTILGIQAEFAVSALFDGDLVFLEVKIIKGGVRSTTDLDIDGEPITTGENIYSYGSPTQLWGESWTTDDINDTGFGVSMKVMNGDPTTRSCDVNFMRLTVTASDPPPPTYMLPAQRRGR